MTPKELLRHYVTGAIERGESAPIIEQTKPEPAMTDKKPTCKLVNKNGIEVPVGTILTTRDGEQYTLTGFRAGYHAGSSGRVFVVGNGFSREYYPHVFDLKVEVLPPAMTEEDVVMMYVDDLLRQGMRLSVNDGEKWVLRWSTDRNDIKAVLFSTGEDIIKVYNAEGQSQGSLFFVYGNSPAEVLSDYSTKLHPLIEVTNEYVELFCG